MRRATFALLTIAALTACTPPKYVSWTSVQRDWKAGVPWGWRVITDRDGTAFASTTFIGAFEPTFFLGAPSLSVRWHAYSRPHRLPNGFFEVYTSVDDYIRQMLEQVYGPKRVMKVPVTELTIDGRRWRHFVVQAAAPVPPRYRWGTARDPETDGTIIVRQHAYAVLPMKSGFYAVAYPGTVQGYDLYEPHFNQLVNSFTPLTDGPGGAALEQAPAPHQAAVAGRPPFAR